MITNYFHLLRSYPKECHKKTSKHNHLVIEKTMKHLLTKKHINYHSRWCVNRKCGRVKRLYYHDNKYIDPWILSSNLHKKIRTEDVVLPRYNYGNNDIAIASKRLSDIQLKQSIIKAQNQTPEKELKRTQTIDSLYIEKILFKPKNKIKSAQYSCMLMTADQAFFNYLSHYKC